MKYQVRVGTGKTKCTECKKSIPSGELEFGTAAVSFGESGSTFFRHPGCSVKSQLAALLKNSNFDSVEGWDSLSKTQQDALQQALVARSEEKEKKAEKKATASPKRKKDTDGGKSKRAKGGEKEKKEKNEKKDKSGPKKGRTAYVLFSLAKRAEVSAANPDAAPKDLMGLLAAEWKQLADKDEWKAAAVKDKERYERQVEEFEKTGTFTKTPEEEADDAKKEEKAKQKKDKPETKKPSKKAATKDDEGGKEEEDNAEEKEETKEEAEEGGDAEGGEGGEGAEEGGEGGEGAEEGGEGGEGGDGGEEGGDGGGDEEVDE